MAKKIVQHIPPIARHPRASLHPTARVYSGVAVFAQQTTQKCIQTPDSMFAPVATTLGVRNAGLLGSVIVVERCIRFLVGFLIASDALGEEKLGMSDRARGEFGVRGEFLDRDQLNGFFFFELLVPRLSDVSEVYMRRWWWRTVLVLGALHSPFLLTQLVIVGN
ncbi:hypothetical protein L873DRAFT_251666 [Choiromyces venosus 120613-1]|uniref:Uncharacterized protein n=1 Tax=Choiromyces venosus 120613-1 TaxID=1336337 RepID=A0A3N4J6E9_9PEZI|nr:hypothetical protein L873DRAFT_251666 [Choiromyces venosus 120613-1]